MQFVRRVRAETILLTGDGKLVPWPWARIDIQMTTLHEDQLKGLLAPHAWERCINHAPFTATQIARLYSRGRSQHDHGQALRRTGRRIVAAKLEEDVVGLNLETLRVIFARSSDRLELLALVYSHSPRGVVR